MKKKCFIDRIEDSTAVIYDLTGQDKAEIPAAWLPQDSREGDVVDFGLIINKKATIELAADIRKIKRSLESS